MIEALTVSQVILWLVVLVLAAVSLLLARQVGRLHERIAPLGALMIDQGLQVGKTVPVVEVNDFEGHSLRIGSSAGSGKAVLLTFVSPHCPACKKLIPAIKSFARAEGDHLEILFVSDGSREDNELFIRDECLKNFRFILSPQIGMMYQVGKLPYAILIDQNGVLRAKGLVNTREHLESLIVAHEIGHASVQSYLKTRPGVARAGPRELVPGTKSMS